MHYTNFPTKGILPYETGEAWLTAWAKRIYPAKFKILGGEPTINPELAKFIYLCRKLWKTTNLIMTTNGGFLERPPGLAEALYETGTVVHLSTHHATDERYLTMHAKARQWLEDNHINHMVDDNINGWYKTYKGETPLEARPYSDNAQRQSWAVCVSKYCMQLHANRLWKCAPLAYLDHLEENAIKLGGRLHEDWKPYLGYVGIGVTASDEDLAKFLAQEDEWMCNMCPANPEPYVHSIR